MTATIADVIGAARRMIQQRAARAHMRASAWKRRATVGEEFAVARELCRRYPEASAFHRDRVLGKVFSDA
jgi:hypothetical protein